MSETFTVRLPRTYGEDALYRGLDIGRVIRRTRNQIVLECTREHLGQLASDAYYYSDANDYDPCYRSLCRSARAALVRIEAARAHGPLGSRMSHNFKPWRLE